MRRSQTFWLMALAVFFTAPLHVEAVAFKCPNWVKKLNPRRTTEPARYGDIKPHAERMTPQQIGRLIVKFAEESFDHGIYFEDKNEKNFFITSVNAFMALSIARENGKIVPISVDPFSSSQICDLLKRVKMKRENPEDVTIRDYLQYFYKDELYLQTGLESLPKRGWKRPYRFIGWALKYLLIGAGLAMGWETYQAITGSFASSLKEMTSAEGRLQSYRSLMSGLLSYDPRQGIEGLEERRQLVKEIFVGANSTMTDPEILGRDLVLMMDEAVAAQSTSLRLAANSGDIEESWIILERLYYLENFFPDIWANPLGFGTRQRIRHLFETYDSQGELRRILEANQFQEAFSLKFNIGSQNNWWDSSDPMQPQNP